MILLYEKRHINGVMNYITAITDNLALCRTPLKVKSQNQGKCILIIIH